MNLNYTKNNFINRLLITFNFTHMIYKIVLLWKKFKESIIKNNTGFYKSWPFLTYTVDNESFEYKNKIQDEELKWIFNPSFDTFFLINVETLHNILIFFIFYFFLSLLWKLLFIDIILLYIRIYFWCLIALYLKHLEKSVDIILEYVCKKIIKKYRRGLGLSIILYMTWKIWYKTIKYGTFDFPPYDYLFSIILISLFTCMISIIFMQCSNKKILIKFWLSCYIYFSIIFMYLVLNKSPYFVPFVASDLFLVAIVPVHILAYKFIKTRKANSKFFKYLYFNRDIIIFYFSTFLGPFLVLCWLQNTSGIILNILQAIIVLQIMRITFILFLHSMVYTRKDSNRVKFWNYLNWFLFFTLLYESSTFLIKMCIIITVIFIFIFIIERRDEFFTYYEKLKKNSVEDSYVMSWNEVFHFVICEKAPITDFEKVSWELKKKHTYKFLNDNLFHFIFCDEKSLGALKEIFWKLNLSFCMIFFIKIGFFVKILILVAIVSSAYLLNRFKNKIFVNAYKSYKKKKKKLRDVLRMFKIILYDEKVQINFSNMFWDLRYKLLRNEWEFKDYKRKYLLTYKKESVRFSLLWKLCYDITPNAYNYTCRQVIVSRYISNKWAMHVLIFCIKNRNSSLKNFNLLQEIKKFYDKEFIYNDDIYEFSFSDFNFEFENSIKILYYKKKDKIVFKNFKNFYTKKERKIFFKLLKHVSRIDIESPLSIWYGKYAFYYKIDK